MTRLILINGMPGLGKSTLARRYAEDHPGTLVCDVDVLRTFIGGWRDDFIGAGAKIRPAAIGLITGYLRGSGDVVFPQLLARVSELERFELAARDAGADFVHIMLTSETDAAIRRFRDRDDGTDAWHSIVQSIVEEEGGDEHLRAYAPMLAEMVSARPAIRLIRSVDNEVETTYEACLNVLAG